MIITIEQRKAALQRISARAAKEDGAEPSDAQIQAAISASRTLRAVCSAACAYSWDMPEVVTNELYTALYEAYECLSLFISFAYRESPLILEAAELAQAGTSRLSSECDGATDVIVQAVASASAAASTALAPIVDAGEAGEKRQISGGTERRAFKTKFELRTSPDGKRTIRAYAALFNSLSNDLGGFREIIAPGAFTDVLQDDCRALINHDSNLILGRSNAGTLIFGQDDVGLWWECELGDRSYERDLCVSMDRGDIDQCSFAFMVDKKDDRWSQSDGGMVRTINKFSKLQDVSVVTFPAYPETSANLRSDANPSEAARAAEPQGGTVAMNENRLRLTL